MNPPSQPNFVDPRHVAIIMDGNGRWATQRGLPRIEGHRRGVENVREILRAAREANLEYLTLFAFSVENWKRPPQEISGLMGLLEHFLKRCTTELLDHQIRLRVIGRPENLPPRIREKLERTITATERFHRHNLVIALNYGARTELVDAVKAYARAVQAGEADPETLDWPGFSRYFYTADIPDPDLLVRTSGESRLSNFLLMQLAYSELYFSPVLWPEFRQEEFLKAIAAYRARERRFGLTGEQVRHSETGREPALPHS